MHRARGAHRGAAAQNLVHVLAVACVLGGCKGTGTHEAVEGGAATIALAPRDAGTATVVDAAPADDLVPQASADELAARGRHLLEAVVKDDATLAVDILFPRDGWLAARDAADPGKDWDHRVDTPFRKALHHLSQKHHDLARAQFVSLELGRSLFQASPRRHGWKKPLWTVHDSRLTFVVDGHTRMLPIHEMTAWRGAWYVTRLR